MFIFFTYLKTLTVFYHVHFIYIFTYFYIIYIFLHNLVYQNILLLDLFADDKGTDMCRELMSI